MDTNLGETETFAHERTRRSTSRLLESLIEHHDFRMPRPPKTIPIFVVPPSKEKIEVCVLPIAAPKITVEAIKRVVCLHYSVKHSDMLSPRRDMKIRIPRMVAIYLTREFTQNSLPAIGRQFGNRDHTTAWHSVNKIADLIMTDPAIAADVQTLSEQLSA